jgi:hypothetical protein
MTITEYFDNFTVDRLRDVCKAAGVRPGPLRKQELVVEVAKAYSDPANIMRIYKSVNEGEKKLIDLYLVNEGYPDPEMVEELAKVYSMKGPSSYSFEYYDDYGKVWGYIDRGSPAAALFPGHYYMPSFIYSVLSKTIEKKRMPSDCEEYVPLNTDKVICREHRLTDFATMALYCAGTNVAIGARGLASKAALAKMAGNLKWDDVFDCNGKFVQAKEAPKACNLRITASMYMLAMLSNLFDKNSEMARLAQGAPQHEIAKGLLKCYLENQLYDEEVFLQGLKFSFETPRWVGSRKAVSRILTGLTPGKFYKYDDFEKWVKTTSYGFLFAHVGAGMDKHYYETEYAYTGWELSENRTMHVMLTFFCAMGLVDLAFSESTVRYYKEKDRELAQFIDEVVIVSTRVTGLRLTQLGAFVLGMENSYEVKELKKGNEIGLVVTPDFFVVLDGRKTQLDHSPYLSRFLERMPEIGDTATYKIDFSGFVRALDQGISGNEIIEYLKESSVKPVPENVLKTIEDWNERSKKIRIQKITVVETDDEFLLAELAGIKGVAACGFKPLQSAARINDSDAGKFKKLLEKNGKYVKVKE